MEVAMHLCDNASEDCFKKGKNMPQRVHYINILHALKLSDISHIREG